MCWNNRLQNSRELLVQPKVKTAKQYQPVSRENLCGLTGIPTSHCKLGIHLFRMKLLLFCYGGVINGFGFCQIRGSMFGWPQLTSRKIPHITIGTFYETAGVMSNLGWNLHGRGTLVTNPLLPDPEVLDMFNMWKLGEKVCRGNEWITFIDAAVYWYCFIILFLWWFSFFVFRQVSSLSTPALALLAF